MPRNQTASACDTADDYGPNLKQDDREPVADGREWGWWKRRHDRRPPPKYARTRPPPRNSAAKYNRR